MKLSDYVVDFLVRQGIFHNFYVSGGAVVHLVDSAENHPLMTNVAAQHEQNGAAAADMYARVTENIGLVMTTSGPGATNIITSVCNAYFDSIPMICITGQVARFRIRKTPKLRQRGFQETDVVSIFQSVTKYSKLVVDPEMIRYELEKAIYIAKEGRPGPVLLDIPDDLQRVEINPEKLIGFTKPLEISSDKTAELLQLFDWIYSAKRPLLLYGAGVNCAKTKKEAVQFAEHFNMPVVLTWGGADLFPLSHPLNMGRVGVCGPRSGNFAVQNADLIITMGTRLSQMVTGGKQNLFAPQAKKVMIDVDEEELNKFGPDTFSLDLQIASHLKPLFKQIEKILPPKNLEDPWYEWKQLIRSWNIRYPIYEPKYLNAEKVSPYVFVKAASTLCKAGDIIIGDTGANISWTLQTFETKSDQRIFSAWNHTPMGYSLPASVGAAFATNRTIVCFIGDGGLMMCLQELGTIRRHNLPVKIFLFNNAGHGIQKQTMDTWLGSRYVGVNQETGLYFPDYKKIAEAFEIPYFKIGNHRELENLATIWHHEGPFFCNVEMVPEQKIVPMLKFGAGLEDLDPKLNPEEIADINRQCEHLNELTHK